jgi:hypothetical protein
LVKGHASPLNGPGTSIAVAIGGLGGGLRAVLERFGRRLWRGVVEFAFDACGAGGAAGLCAGGSGRCLAGGGG